MNDNKLTDKIKEVVQDSKDWVNLQVEYAKLTAAEKITILGGAVALVTICLLISVVILFVLTQCLVDAFELIMSPVLACLSVSGILLLLMLVFIVFKKPLIMNPIAKFLTKLFLS
ncbi:MAG: hypothetical protein HDR95_03085 [Bacteroides sp.]|nr:hypothetical protein [Bacteroides sp.]